MNISGSNQLVISWMTLKYSKWNVICEFQWIGSKEHLQESLMIFMGQFYGFPVKIFPTKPIHWVK